MKTFYDENNTLEFLFNEDQDVLQYDSSQFYREKIEKRISGICAVDFLCMDRRQKYSYFTIFYKNGREYTLNINVISHRNQTLFYGEGLGVLSSLHPLSNMEVTPVEPSRLSDEPRP